MSETTPRRSHNGCWTCKARRRKCDRTRPTCQACDQRGLVCEGYEVRLRWGSGIASRGRFTGAPEPIISSVPARPKGRRRDRSRERRRLSPAEQATGPPDDPEVEFDPNVPCSSDQSLYPKRRADDENLFREFCSTGINILHSTTVQDPASLLGTQLPVLCQGSDSLYRVCLALQVSITSPSLKDNFFEYYDAALNQFRAELACNVTRLEDGTFTAGLLLCSIGQFHGMPWTMHLQGMYNILQMQGLSHSHAQNTPFRTHLLEVMGVMDLPTFTIGRKRPCIGVWKRYCRDRITNTAIFDGDGIEVVSGLPRSLIDLFSCVDDGVTEEDFWDWPGARGSLLQYQLWEAYRLAGILTVRHGQLFPPREGNDSIGRLQNEGRREPPRRLLLPPSEVLVGRILSSVDAICRTAAELEGSLIVNAINYPFFVAGLQARIIRDNPELQRIVESLYSRREGAAEAGREQQLLYSLLQGWWESYQTTPSIHNLAEARGLELGLF